eukprot:CAMPEP_0194066042 /NCGR_PEP_ID=MMETSP0009_2-20130614/85806_1 /TAXON_ID=210454 /ORGANISM="Grammatophora oceanica, Strain CCMP 410" /LENGTH=85 /DNA_ID=CAMNT_0038718957 /DNA_START=477 /DNA_END=734 /DNA_ORIENTATION=-
MKPATDAGKKHLPAMYVDGLYDSIELCVDPKRCVDRNAVHKQNEAHKLIRCSEEMLYFDSKKNVMKLRARRSQGGVSCCLIDEVK